jgi:hypothetical protein
MALHTERAVTSLFDEEVLFIFSIVWLVTGSAHQLSSGTKKYRISVSPLLWDVCSLPRDDVKGVDGALKGLVS